jgi:hypothetical protein
MRARFRPALAALALLAAPLAVQAQGGAPAAPAANRNADPDKNVAGGVTVPGWTARFDRPNAQAAQVSFARMGGGLHVTSGPAAVYYDAKQVARGNFALKASFTQTKAPAHPEAYGLMLAGDKLQSPEQSYLYFIVRGDGKYMIRHRAGSEVHGVVEWTEHPAVTKADAAGKATNALEVRADAKTVRYLVNGTEVKSFDRGQAMMKPDGIVGVRVNHNLDVHIDGFALTK